MVYAGIASSKERRRWTNPGYFPEAQSQAVPTSKTTFAELLEIASAFAYCDPLSAALHAEQIY